MASPDIKREFERHLVETETLIVELRDGQGRSSSGRTRNMSPGGAYVETDEPPPLGAEVQLFIGSARAAAALRTAATVVHVDAGQGFGAKFLDVDEESRDYVATFIKRFCKK